MKLKDRIKTYNFWVSLSSAIFLLLKVLGQQFGFYVDENIFTDLMTSLCGILVILGIIVPPINKTKVEIFASTESNPETKTNTTTPVERSTNAEIIEPIDETSLSSENILSSNEVVIENLNEPVIENNPVEGETNGLENSLEIQKHKLKAKIAQTLADQEKLFEDDLNEYIELLQNQINLIRNK